MGNEVQELIRAYEDKKRRVAQALGYSGRLPLPNGLVLSSKGLEYKVGPNDRYLNFSGSTPGDLVSAFRKIGVNMDVRGAIEMVMPILDDALGLSGRRT